MSVTIEFTPHAEVGLNEIISDVHSVFLKTDKEAAPLLADTMSVFESPSRSIAQIALGLVPVVKSTLGAKLVLLILPAPMILFLKRPMPEKQRLVRLLSFREVMKKP